MQSVRIRKTFTNVHKNRNPKNTRNTYDTLFWFRYETFYYLFEFKVFRHEERETHNFFLCWLFHLIPTTCGAHRKLLVWRRRAPKIGLLLLASNLNCLLFFQIPKSSALPGITSFTSPVQFSIFFIVTYLIVTSALRAREHLHSNPSAII